MADLLPDPRRAIGALVNRRTGVLGRHRPFYHLNLVQRIRSGPRTLERAIAGKVVLITGASSGIGEAAARQVAGAGATVLLVARSEDELERVRDEIDAAGGRAEVRRCDLAEPGEVERMAAEVLADHGRVDVLVNNAGRSIRRSVARSTDRLHDFERTMQLNYFGAVGLILAVLPGMRERGSGHVVNVSSAGVQTRTPRFAGYVASKAALDAFSDCVQAEVAHRGVRFTTIHMPLVRTPMIEPTEIYASFPSLSAEEAGEWICEAIKYRPSRIGPPFGALAELADAVSPASMEAIRSAGYRLFGDRRS
jgi:short-subunit dehydrogenase